LSDFHLPSPSDPDDLEGQPEVRLELTRAGVQQVLSLYSQEQESNRSEFEFSLRLDDLQAAFRERRRIVGMGLGAGIAFGCLVLLMSTTLYPVTAQVVLERHEVLSSSIGGELGSGGSAFIATQAEVMHSPSVISAAVASIPRAEHLDDEDDAVADAVESVQAAPVTGTQVVALGYLGPDADHGVRLLGAIVEAYRGVLRDNEQKSQNQILRAKQAEIEMLDSEAVNVERQIEALRGKHRMLGTAEEAAAAQSALLEDHTAQLAEIRNQRITLENRLATGGEQLAILDPATRLLQEQLWQAEAELSRVQLTLKSRHPAVERARQEVEVLRKHLKANSQATPDALRRDIEAVRGLEAQLGLVYEIERERMAEIERYRRDEENLLVEVGRIREMSDARRSELLDQRLVARLAESGEVGITARLIEAPMLPEEATWPKPKLVLIGSAMIGLLGGLVMAIISLRRNRAEWLSGPSISVDEATLS
jgi:uncharacterized protein involved in exopolysaccharide biosynthesis